MTPEGLAAPARKPSRDDTLIKALVRAHRWRRRIESGHAKSITDLAEQEGVTDAYICRLLPLTCLAPGIVEAILDGRQSKGLRLAEMLGNGPMGWEKQRMSWGTRLVDGEVSDRTEDRWPRSGSEPSPLKGPETASTCWLGTAPPNQPSSPTSSASRIQSSGASRATSSKPGSLPARGA